MEATVGVIHPAFLKFMELCRKINFGVIKELKIQDGLPVFVKHETETELDAIVELSKKLV